MYRINSLKICHLHGILSGRGLLPQIRHLPGHTQGSEMEHILGSVRRLLLNKTSKSGYSINQQEKQ